MEHASSAALPARMNLLCSGFMSNLSNMGLFVCGQLLKARFIVVVLFVAYKSLCKSYARVYAEKRGIRVKLCPVVRAGLCVARARSALRCLPACAYIPPQVLCATIALARRLLSLVY